MIRYTSQHQIELFEFEHPFEVELDKNNRWVKLSKLLPWDRLVSIYSQSLCSGSGRYGIDGRLAAGALIIKTSFTIKRPGSNRDDKGKYLPVIFCWF